MVSVARLLLLVSSAVLSHLSRHVTCDDVTAPEHVVDLAAYGSPRDLPGQPDEEQVQRLMEVMYRNYPLDQFEDAYGNDLDMDKRRMFVGKRRMFVGKRDGFEQEDDTPYEDYSKRRMFVGKRDVDKRRMFVGKRDFEDANELEEHKRRLFVGKRDQDKRNRYFVGKRDQLIDELEQKLYGADTSMDMDKRRMFVGKRDRYFVGKRDGSIEEEKRRMFVGKRADDIDQDFDSDDQWIEDKRRMFVGKRDNDKRRMFVGKRRFFVGKRPQESSDESWLDEFANNKRRMFVGKRRMFVGKRDQNEDMVKRSVPLDKASAFSSNSIDSKVESDKKH